MQNPLELLKNKYWEVFYEISSPEAARTLGETILWNAQYHLQISLGYNPQIPSFHKGWAMYRDVEKALQNGA
tara:strand:- start:544 stop:759 length:216 start_codon:yes stop_codon:yes gene_type:complete